MQPKKKSAEWHYQQGKNQMTQTDTYEAIKSFTQAIKKKPDYIDAYMERAKANISVDSVQNAVRDYDSLLVKINPNDYMRLGEIYFLKGDALYLVSEDTLACDNWKKAQDLNNQTSWDRIRKRCK